MVLCFRRVSFVAVIASFLLIAIASNGFAQKQRSKPDLTGTWLLDAKKSNSVGLTSRPNLPIKVSHQDPELHITLTSELNGQKVERQFVYFTDGRGEENQATTMLTANPGVPPPDLQKARTKSHTRWSGNKIVTRSILRLIAAGRSVEFEQIDEWSLSPNGATLTQRVKVIPVTGEGVLIMAAERKRVYNRV